MHGCVFKKNFIVILNFPNKAEHTNGSALFALRSALSSSIGLHLGRLHYSFSLQRPTVKTVLLQAFKIVHMRSRLFTGKNIFRLFFLY